MTMMVASRQCHSPLSSRFTVILPHAIRSERLSLFIARFEYPTKWCTYNADWLLHGYCHREYIIINNASLPDVINIGCYKSGSLLTDL